VPAVPPFPPPPRPTPTTISTLAGNVLARLQDPDATFWDLKLAVYPALVEAINDLMLIIGRPTTLYQIPIQLVPNVCWQPMPENMLAITNVQSNLQSLWKVSLRTMDFTQSSWTSSWETDVAASPLRWFPLGMTFWGVHPAVSQLTTVLVTGVGYPVPQAVFPPTGLESTVFHEEFNQALELYATAYLRLCELGDDAQEGQELYQAYLKIAQRMTSIEDRRDSLSYSQAFGVPNAPSRVTLR
jgi:hypothetical protein